MLADEVFKPSCRERNFGLKRLRSERNFPIKKRKSLHYSSVSSSDGGIVSDGTSYSPENDVNEDSAPYLKLHGGCFPTCFCVSCDLYVFLSACCLSDPKFLCSFWSNLFGS